MRDITLGWIDLETGGLDPARHAVVEVAMARTDVRGKILDTREFLVAGAEGGLIVEDEARALHHLDGRKGLPIQIAYEEIRSFLRGTVCAGQNVQFDLRFVEAMRDHAGAIAWADHHVIDLAAMLMPRWISGELASLSLHAVCTSLGVRVHEPAHRAMSDVLTAIDLYRRVIVEASPGALAVRCEKFADTIWHSSEGATRECRLSPLLSEEVRHVLQDAGRMIEVLRMEVGFWKGRAKKAREDAAKGSSAIESDGQEVIGRCEEDDHEDE